MSGLVTKYLAAKQAIWDHCGYKEDWVTIPLEDSTEYYWYVDPKEDSECAYAEKVENLEFYIKNRVPKNDDLYVEEIYTQRFLPKWVYRGAEYTLVCVDTHTDGNKFLRIFLNRMEVKGD
jgi:hypothetical protein